MNLFAFAGDCGNGYGVAFVGGKLWQSLINSIV